MEENLVKSPNTVLRILRKTILTILIYVLVYEVVITAIAPIKKINELNSQTESDSVYMATTVNWTSDSTVQSLVLDRSLKQAKLIQANADSIELTINFSDSTISMFLKGVQIFQSKARYMNNDQVFKKISVPTFVRLFSEPLKIESENTTIVKEPILIRKAPKDSAEVAQNAAWKPDTLNQEPAFLKFRTVHGFDIIFEQSEINDFKNKIDYLKFEYQDRVEQFKLDMKALFNFKVPEYYPTIRIKMPASELRTIYRALPAKPRVLIIT